MRQVYRIDCERGFVLSAGFGDLTPTDFFAHYRRLVNDPEFDPSFHHLIDLTRVKECTLTPGIVGMFADERFLSLKSRRAFLVESPDVLTSMSEFQDFCDSLVDAAPVRVFDEFEPALAWLLSPEAAA